VALDLATELSEDPDWSTKKIVVFGTGAYAGATMSLLRERGCTDVSVYSSSGRAAGFVATRGGTALDGETLPAAVAAADVMIGCSGADTRVEAAELATVRAASPQPLIAIDLALTHDFDPAVGELDGVELLTLESVRLAAPQEQSESLAQASSIVAGAASAFEQEREARSVDSAIVALRRHTMNVLDTEMEKVRARHGCTAAVPATTPTGTRPKQPKQRSPLLQPKSVFRERPVEHSQLGQWPGPVTIFFRSDSCAPPFFASVEHASSISRASVSTCSRLIVSLTSARMIVTSWAFGGRV